jgi:hypothetical protein
MTPATPGEVREDKTMATKWKTGTGMGLFRYRDDGSYHGSWDPSKETPAIGDQVQYLAAPWKAFTMPAIGEKIYLGSVDFGPEFTLGTARFQRADHYEFMDDTAIGYVPDSRSEYTRIA